MTEDIPTADWFAWFMELQELFTTLTVSQNYIDSILLYDNNGEQIRGLFSVGYSIPAEALLNDDFYIRETSQVPLCAQPKSACDSTGQAD